MQDVTEQDGLTLAVLYAAKSTQDRHKSIPAQLDDCRRMAAENGWRVVGEYEDEGFSAYSRSRGPGLAKAREHAARAAAESDVTAMLVAQHSDRFSRGAGDKPGAAEALIEIWHAERRRDVHLRSVQDDFDLRTSATVANMGERNHSDSKRKAAATKAGKQRAAERGEWQGRVPDGYLVERTPNGVDVTRRIVFDPERHEIYELMWGLAVEGASTNTIVRELGARGYMTEPRYGVKRERPAQARPFNTSRVLKTLGKDFYAGRLTYGDIIGGEGHWPAYVEPDDFDRLVRERLVRRRRGSGNPVGRPPGGLLARLAHCGKCGEPAVHYSGNPRKDGTRPRRYICEAHKRRPGVCDAPPYDADLVERTVLGGLEELLGRADAWIKALDASRDQQRSRHEAEAGAAAREIADSEAAISKLSETFSAAIVKGDKQGERLAKDALARHEDSIARAECLQRAAEGALAAEEAEPEPDMHEGVARLLRSLSDDARAARGDVTALNGILREHFESMVLTVGADGQLLIEPTLNAETVQRLLDENRAATRRTNGEPVSWRHWSYDRDPADPEHWALQPVAAKLASSK